MNQFQRIFLEKGIGDAIASVGRKVGRAVATGAHHAANVVVPGYQGSQAAGKYERGMNDRSAGQAQAKAIRPPKGFTPIPGSKHGGYHKQVGNTWQSWYPDPAAAAEHERHQASSAVGNKKSGATHSSSDMESLESHHTHAKHSRDQAKRWQKVAEDASKSPTGKAHDSWGDRHYSEYDATTRAQQATDLADHHHEAIAGIEKKHASLQGYSNALRLAHKTGEHNHFHDEVTRDLDAESEKARTSRGGVSVSEGRESGGVSVVEKAGRSSAAHEFKAIFDTAK